MGSSAELGNLALLHGLTKKRYNAIVAMLSGALPGVKCPLRAWRRREAARTMAA